ncbi:Copper homeostasis protein cutC homolog [Madurella fahalii]|uniref:Copper homeostasis protein cutC homolog n=1 Tax=Madurella fahalii TaxID=1157608 RepID=A0ABQ0G921_9PEZI
MPSSDFQSRLEVPIFGEVAGAQAASIGASRLELNCSGSYALGGTTPTESSLFALRSALSFHGANRPAIRIMIRPRGPPPPPATASPQSDSQAQTEQQQQQQQQQKQPLQDFIYTPAELATMADSIREFAASGLLDPALGDGFVFGVLRSPPGRDGRSEKEEAEGAVVELDVAQNRRLVELARPFKCVLHRAVDDVFSSCVRLAGLRAGAGIDAAGTTASAAAGAGGDGDGDGDGRRGQRLVETGVEEMMRQVKSCGFDGMLTSGGKGRAVDNVGCLKAVIAAAGRHGVEVIVGGGVRSGNLGRLMDGLGEVGGSVWCHSSCLKVDAEAKEMFDVEEARGLVEGLRSAGWGL